MTFKNKNILIQYWKLFIKKEKFYTASLLVWSMQENTNRKKTEPI